MTHEPYPLDLAPTKEIQRAILEQLPRRVCGHIGALWQHKDGRVMAGWGSRGAGPADFAKGAFVGIEFAAGTPLDAIVAYLCLHAPAGKPPWSAP